MSLSLLLWSAYERLWTLPTTIRDLSGRTVIVTGSNTGLGFEAAKAMYGLNPARLILAVRSTAKGEEAKKAIVTSTNKYSPPSQDRDERKIEVWELDLVDFGSVKRFSERCKRELERLDVLLENAGMLAGQWALTKDGWETSLQTNVIATFMLASLLMPILEKTAELPSPVPDVVLKPHLVVVASDVHGVAQFPQQSQPHALNALNDKAQYIPRDRYSTTKLLDVLLTRQLAQGRVFQNGKVVVCTVNPGLCQSELARNVTIPPFRKWMMYNVCARTTEEGAKNLVWGSLVDGIPPGSYVSSCSVTNPSPFVRSDEGTTVQKKLWNEIRDVITKLAPETTDVWKE